jgi:hypothetical protein
MRDLKNRNFAESLERPSANNICCYALFFGLKNPRKKATRSIARDVCSRAITPRRSSPQALCGARNACSRGGGEAVLPGRVNSVL